MAAERIVIPALKLVQPIGEFYIARMKFSEVIKISTVDVREMEDNELDKYMGVQRRLNPDRVKEIQRYVNSYDATFPTAIILAIPEECVQWDEAQSELALEGTAEKPLDEIARVIDGQHRIEGLKAFQEDNFDLNVSLFVGADVATQANIFATVNLAQTKVNRSLVYDLLDYEKSHSPQKSAHHIAVALDQSEKSPFFRRIKRLGTANPELKGETLTQAAVVESLMPHMTDDAMVDRESFFRKWRAKPPSPEMLNRRIFRGLFLEHKEREIAKILIEYFQAVREKWPHAWDDVARRGNVLPKTNGFKALMRFLRPAYLEIVGNDIGRVVERAEFAPIFGRVDLEDEDFNIQTFPPGTSGESRLFNILKASVPTPQLELYF